MTNISPPCFTINSQKFDKFQISKKEIASKCFRLQFEHDVEEQKLIDDENKKKKEEYESAHRYDGFQASVSYDYKQSVFVIIAGFGMMRTLQFYY